MSNEEKSGLKHWVPAFVLMVCVVLAFFDKISIAVLFSDPHFQSSMGIAEDKAKLGWLMTSFLLAYGFSSVFLSFLGDIFNPKKMLFWSVTSWGVLMLCMGFTTSYSGMLILRVLLGLAEGPLFALAYTIVKQTYTDRQQARASTMFLLGTPIGAFLGFPITAAVLAHHDWHTTFFVMAALTLIAILSIVFGLRNLQLKKTVELEGESKRTNFKGGVGIAAPQVYISKRVIIVASRPNPRYPDAPEMNAVVMVNPEILEFSSETCLGEEGCLSVPDERGQVERAEMVKVKYLTLQGEAVETIFHGFPARIVQHEVDHLNGILFVERIS